MATSGTTATCPAGSTTDTSSLDNAQCAANAFGKFGFGSSGVACYGCAPTPAPPPYDCGPGTALSSYCNNGPKCAYGYGYSYLYSCDPNMWDGCCVACAPGQTCDASVGGGYIPNGNCGWTYCPPQCNQTTCTSWSSPYNCPTNTCYNGNCTESRYCTWNLYNGSTTCHNYNKTNFYQYRNVTVDNCSTNYTCSSGGACVTNIYVHVYTDWEHDGIKNNGDVGKAGVTVSDHGGNTPTTDSTGSVTFSGKTTGTYTISITVPSGYAGVGAISKSVSLTNTSGNVTVNFFVTPLYKISGNIYNDKNKNLKYDGADTLYTSSTTVHVAGGPTSVADMNQVDGTYDTGQVLESGTYTVSQTHALANGYNYTTASTWAVTLGDPAGGKTVCNSGSSLDASCTNPNNGSVTNLNFGVTNENPWGQSVCFDVRDDSGSYTDQIPAAPSCGGVSGAYNSVTNADCSTGAGIIFTCDATPDFGLGSANANAWQSGGPGTQQECFSGAGLNVIRTSYDYLLTTARESGIVPTDLSTICNLTSCSLPSNLSKGVYIAHGDVHLNAYTFPVSATQPQGFIFLIDGNLYVQGNVLVPAGSVAAFSTSGNIYVNQSVGNVVTSTSDPAVNNPNIEGLYSADADFIILSYGSANNYCNADGTPKDKKLNIVGSIITNAAQKGGALINNRDLCIYDLDCSSLSYGDGENGNEGLGLSYILTLFADGKFLNHKLFNWQELKP